MTLEDRLETIVRDVLRKLAPKRLGVAVSGGSDSTALLVLLHAWVEGTGCKLFAMSVDHGLRSEAANEIERVRKICRDLDVPHEVARWHWDNTGNLQDAARRGRRTALRNWARKNVLDAVALGHTADDQAETVLMRLARGSGVDGLAAMSEHQQEDGFCIVRPLLTARRGDLRDFLKQKTIPWSDDPSNEDTRFDRVKARQLLHSLTALGLRVERLTQTAAHMRNAQSVLEHAARELQGHAVRQEFGDLIIDRAALSNYPDDTVTRLVANALIWVSGNAYRPRYKALVPVIETASPQTLHGCLVSPVGDFLRISREYSAVRELRVATGELWDRRWCLTGPGSSEDVVAALGEAGIRQCPEWRETGIPRAALMASPAVWRGETLVSAPIAGLKNGWIAQFCPPEGNFM